MKTFIITIIAVLFALGLGLWFVIYQNTPTRAPERHYIPTTPTTPPKIPDPIPPSTPTTTDTTDTTDKPMEPLPNEFVIDDVQFASQAPLKDWSLPYKEFCEEASALMAAFYALGKTVPSSTELSTELWRIKEYEEKKFGYYQDTTAQETATILKEFYGITDVALIQNPSVDDIKRQLYNGKAIILPAAGQILNSPYYQQPGPLFHMIVIKGYTADDYFVTQDPGTNTKGENFEFSIPTIMDALHDWNNGDVYNGAKVIIAVGKEKK